MTGTAVSDREIRVILRSLGDSWQFGLIELNYERE